jgi:hypothetical protein
LAPERDKQFRMNLSEEERAMLEDLSEADGITASDYLRLLIRRQHSERFGAKPKKKRQTPT